MNIALSEKWESFVEDKVKSGDYQTASEVLQEGLRLLEKGELLKKFTVNSMSELEDKLEAAVKSLEAGEGLDGEEVLRELREKAAAYRRRA